jgi:hypothetical protein
MTPKAGAEHEVLFNEPARLPCFCLVSSSSGRSKTAVLQSSKSEKKKKNQQKNCTFFNIN